MQASSERQKQASRRSQLRRAKSDFWLISWLRWASLKAGYVLSDHTRNALILAVFAFKVGILNSDEQFEPWHICLQDSMGTKLAPAKANACWNQADGR